MKEVAENYAKVLLSEDVNFDKVTDCKNTLLNNKELFDLLCSPIVSNNEKHSINTRIFSTEIVPFLNLLCDNNRMDLFMNIYDVYKSLILKNKGIAEAEFFYTSMPENEQINSIKNIICKKEGLKDIKFTFKQDSSLLGGFKIKIHNKEYDRSIKNNLYLLKNRLLQEVVR